MHPIIFLWSHPRSVSSAMERIMLERGDMATFHEPFLYLYYVHDRKKSLDHFVVDPAQPTSYEDIRDMLLEAAEHRAVFVKDMCYYVSDYVYDDPEFLRRITNTFLIRNPEQAVPSYFKLDPAPSSDEIGIESQCRQFEFTTALIGRTPAVVDAGDLTGDTEGLMRRYCEAIDVPFLPHALQWSAELPKSWEHVSGWHTDLGEDFVRGQRGSKYGHEEILRLHPSLSLGAHHLHLCP